jgi:hypothetical protein
MIQQEQIKALVSEYQKDFGDTGEDLVRIDLLGKGYTHQEVEEVIAALTKGLTDGQIVTKSVPKNTTKPTPKEATEPSPNEDIKARLAKIDHNSLHGERFADYFELVESLPADKMYDFEVVKVETINQTRFEGVPGSPIDVIGIRLTSTKPVATTRVYAKTAIAQNGRLVRGRNYFEVIGQQFHQNRLFYLLKK